MNKKLLYGLLLIWTLFVPTLVLLIGKTEAPVNLSSASSSIKVPRYKLQKLWTASHKGESLNSSVFYEGDTDSFSLSALVKKALPMPSYFFVALYAVLLFQFFSFFKRKLPFCAYLALPAHYRFLTLRDIRI
ncbi:hypothetical protein ACL9RF_11870 [Sphingobacterium sp. Mn56C]|uniref:hypothetical protein n=1 Tax=Sphingobacterium sp. Mn56C TaxID=3395261 RepID=UPI003BD5BCAC